MIRVTLILTMVCAFVLPNIQPVFAGEDSTPMPDRPVTICVEDRYWPPSSFFVDGEAQGLQVTMIRTLMTRLGIEHTFQRMPWNRCFSSASGGTTDAILGMLYLPERNKDFQYPKGAKTLLSNAKALQHMAFLIVTREETELNQPSRENLPPSPIGVPMGYPAADSYRQLGANVVEVANHKDLLDLLARGRINSLHLAKPLFEFFISQPAYAGKFKAHPNPENIGPLYMAFSKQSSLPLPVMERIWEELARVRADKKLMQKLRADAFRLSAICLESPARCE